MKKLLFVATALTVIGATPALADGLNTGQDQEVYTINGLNPAKCNVVTDSSTFALADNLISDNDGFARSDLAQTVASRLNAANLTAWCTGNSNSLVLSRSALTTGNGQVTNQFNQAVIYDLQVDIADSGRALGGSVNEGSSDGPGNGPGIGAGNGNPITRFGAAAPGSVLAFVQEPGSTVAAAGNTTPLLEASRTGGSYPERPGFRLVAGTYTGTVTLTLTPGL